MNVPFNKPVHLSGQIDLLQESIVSGDIGGNGPYAKKCETALELLTSHKVRLVTSATHALEMMALLADIKPGDEVILPSFTFVSTANGFALRGARIKFADNDENGNILPGEVDRLMTKKTKAVVAVHYAGASADLDQILEICRSRSIPLFEDAAQCIGADYKGRALGAVGALGCFSFHYTKNITSGEGGALIFGDQGGETLVDRAEIIREKGTNRSQFLHGLTDKYTWVDIGSSYVLSDLNAAYLYPQIQRLDAITNKRKEVWHKYEKELAAALSRHDVKILRTPSYNTPNYHVFAMVFPNGKIRSDFIACMKAQSITCPFHYVSLHTSPFGASFYDGGRPEELPGCENLSQCLVRLPLYYNMTQAEQSYVLEKIMQFFST